MDCHAKISLEIAAAPKAGSSCWGYSHPFSDVTASPTATRRAKLLAQPTATDTGLEDYAAPGGCQGCQTESNRLRPPIRRRANHWPNRQQPTLGFRRLCPVLLPAVGRVPRSTPPHYSISFRVPGGRTGTIPFDEMEQIHLEVCLERDFEAIGWTAVGRELRKLIGDEKTYERINGSRCAFTESRLAPSRREFAPLEQPHIPTQTQVSEDAFRAVMEKATMRDRWLTLTLGAATAIPYAVLGGFAPGNSVPPWIGMLAGWAVANTREDLTCGHRSRLPPSLTLVRSRSAGTRQSRGANCAHEAIRDRVSPVELHTTKTWKIFELDAAHPGTQVKTKCTMVRLLPLSWRRAETHNLHGGNMDLAQQRMECLKMAFELGGKTDTIVGAAQQLLDFVAGKQARSATEEVAEPAPTSVPLAEEQVGSTAPENVAEIPIPDVIAACGTVLVLPESGELADAIPSAQAEQPTAPAATEMAETPIEASSETGILVSEQPSPDQAADQGAASGAVQPDSSEIAPEVIGQSAVTAPEETEAASEAPTNSEKEVAPEQALLATALADAPDTV